MKDSDMNYGNVFGFIHFGCGIALLSVQFQDFNNMDIGAMVGLGQLLLGSLFLSVKSN